MDVQCWFVLGSDGERRGPLTTAELLDELGHGRSNAATWVSPLPAGQWRPLAATPPFADALVAGATHTQRVALTVRMVGCLTPVLLAFAVGIWVL